MAVDLLGHGASPVSTDEGDYRREPVLADIDAVLDGRPGRVAWRTHRVGRPQPRRLPRWPTADSPEGTADALVLVSTGPGFAIPMP